MMVLQAVSNRDKDHVRLLLPPQALRVTMWALIIKHSSAITRGTTCNELPLLLKLLLCEAHAQWQGTELRVYCCVVICCSGTPVFTEQPPPTIRGIFTADTPPLFNASHPCAKQESDSSPLSPDLKWNSSVLSVSEKEQPRGRKLLWALQGTLLAKHSQQHLGLKGAGSWEGLTRISRPIYHRDVCYTALWPTVVTYTLLMGKEKIPLGDNWGVKPWTARCNPVWGTIWGLSFALLSAW